MTQDFEPASNWGVLPARHGILLTSETELGNGKHGSVENGEGSTGRDHFLQDRDTKAELISEPNLSLTLSEEELGELKDTRLAAATHYGSELQDKASNEDFALSAVIHVPGGSEFSFAAVADGVSTKTFWSARAARLACIGAFKAVRAALLIDGIDPGDESRHPEIAEHIAKVVDGALHDDAKCINENGAVPSGWDRSVYEKHKGDERAWYRSTLLFGVIGANGGVIGITGDGGVRGLLLEEPSAQEPLELRVLSSESGRELSSYVSCGFSASDIRLLPLRSRQRTATHVILGSDGLDLTLQRYFPNEALEDGRRCRSRYRDLPLDNSRAAFDFLEKLSRSPEVVPDNLSVARLSWPIQPPGHHWAAWRCEGFEHWTLVAETPFYADVTRFLSTLFTPAQIVPAVASFAVDPAGRRLNCAK